MNYLIQTATNQDLEVLVELINRHELHFDPETTPIGLSDAQDLIDGYFEKSVAAFLVNSETSEKEAFYSVNPDNNRKRLIADVYALPGSPLLIDAIRESLKVSLSLYPEWELWFGVGQKDKVMKQVLESFGMSLLRTYWSMHRPLDKDSFKEISVGGVKLKLTETEEDFRTWWRLHQDSFRNHFGFAPREFDSWKKLVLESNTRDPEGSFILLKDGEPAGFIEMANSNYHLGGGYVAGLGVAHAFQGQGLGKLLLQHGINYSASQGRDFVELNVDTGNTSGALALYEKLGFRAKSAWEQYENKDWADLAKTL